MTAKPRHRGESSTTGGSLPQGAVAVVYVRQSRHKDYERTVSPEDQEAQCRALPAVAACASVEVYRDLDVSGGSTARRKGLQALLDRVRSGEVAVVAALDQSRTFRNTADALAFYALMERHPAVRVEFVKGRFDRSAVGGFTYTTLAAAHELERRMAGEKVRDAIKFMQARGDMVGPVPLGYRRAGGTIEVDEWAPLVCRIFEDYLSGDYSTRTLALRLNAEGVRPPSFKSAWRADTIAAILGHPAYASLTRLDGRRGALELVPASWPALVDKATWEAAQVVLSRRRYGPQGRRPMHRAYTFRNLLRCARCSVRLYAHTVHDTAYYHCRNTGASEGCGAHVREDSLEPWGRDLMAWLEAVNTRRPLVRADVERLLAKAARPPDALAQIDANLKRVGQRFEWGDIDADEYREKRERLLGLRREVMEAERPVAPRVILTGLVETWDRGDKLIRNRLLLNLFADLDVTDGRITGAQPRPDVAAEVAEYLDGWSETLRFRFG